MRTKYEGVIRPILPKNFILSEGILSWDDEDAVYDIGQMEAFDGEWLPFDTVFTNEQQLRASKAKRYRMRVYYNSHWSDYLYTEKEIKEVKEVKEKEIKEVKEVKEKTTKKKK